MGYERNDRRYDRDRYDYDEDRGFFQRAGDEVRSWFGDEDAEHRRRRDERYDERYDQLGRSGYPGYDRSAPYAGDYRRGGYTRGADYGRDAGGYGRADAYPRWARSNRDEDSYRYGNDHGRGDDRYRNRDAFYDRDEVGYGYRREGSAFGGREEAAGGFGQSDDHHGYRSWRDRQVNALDRDYDEYRRENRGRFESEFASWRQNRQTQRDALGSVREHQEVVGSDGSHVGKVDHVRGDNILLTKTDRDAGGHHHSIPSSWIAKVDEKVHLAKTADQAKAAWRDAEERGGLFGADGRDDRGFGQSGHNLNRSFSGTY